jgi:hypothetical protein
VKPALTAFVVSAFIFIGICIGPAVADVWSDSYDPVSKTRFIPVELWTGSAWDGARTINWPKADLYFNGGKRISGPYQWTDPLDGAVKQAYQRYEPKTRKTQWFAVREDGTGIGRIDDSRWKDIERGESKFPTGHWTQGEVRTYDIETYGKSSKRRIEIFVQVKLIMEQIDHSYAGIAHCMTFRWQLTIRTRLADNNAYTYCPGKGLASLDDD